MNRRAEQYMYALYAGHSTEGLETTDRPLDTYTGERNRETVNALKSMVSQHTYVKGGRLMPLTPACDDAIEILITEGIVRVSDSDPTKFHWV